nr:unnamed protein product [Trichobilharzia regenti]
MNGNGPTPITLAEYKVQHLRTFEVAPKNLLPNTQTAVDLLLQECYTHVRSFNMSLVNYNNEPYLLLTDPRNGNREVERFRVSSLIYPRYRSTPPSVCPVNNLLTFTIKAGSMGDGHPKRNEIHLFQVLNCPAQKVVNTLLREGALDHDSNENDFNDSQLIPRAPSEPDVMMPLQTRPMEMQMPLLPKEDSIYSESQINREWIDREVSLLNYCFDDIEKDLKVIKSRTSKQFANSKPSIATSSRSKSRISTVSTDQSTASLPIDLDEQLKTSAVDFYQKVKFAAILLARLEGYVVDPNSSVLVRQLFALLKYAVDATRYPKTKKSNIARSITQPRFPFHAILFIQSNLTQEYEKLWRNLGEAWNTPREEYPMKMTSSYHTLIMDSLQETRYMIPAGAVKSPGSKRDIVQVIDSFQAKAEQELTVEKGEWVEIMDTVQDQYSKLEEPYDLRNMTNSQASMSNIQITVNEYNYNISEKTNLHLENGRR